MEILSEWVSNVSYMFGGGDRCLCSAKFREVSELSAVEKVFLSNTSKSQGAPLGASRTLEMSC